MIQVINQKRMGGVVKRGEPIRNPDRFAPQGDTIGVLVCVHPLGWRDPFNGIYREGKIVIRYADGGMGERLALSLGLAVIDSAPDGG